MLRIKINFIVALAIGFCSIFAPAETIHVPADKPTIQAGIDAASEGDTVLVADGTYIGPGNQDIVLRDVAIKLKSANGPAGCVIDLEGLEGTRAFNFLSEMVIITCSTALLT